MKKYLLPSALILLLGLGAALTQTINKALQLSQDATGAFGVDTSNNVYFPAHVLSTGPGVPTVSALAGSTASTVLAGSTDTIGQFTGGAAGSTSDILFNKAFAAAPTCLLVQSAGTASTLAYTTVATGINISSITGTGVFNYLCSGAK